MVYTLTQSSGTPLLKPTKNVYQYHTKKTPHGDGIGIGKQDKKKRLDRKQKNNNTTTQKIRPLLDDRLKENQKKP